MADAGGGGGGGLPVDPISLMSVGIAGLLVVRLGIQFLRARRDERLRRAPHWHLPGLDHWRAEHLGPEAAARDRARAIEAGHPWAEAFWRADGSLKPLDVLDEAMARLHPEELRGELGLPEGAAVE
jgi:hypothetical protein